MLHTGFISFCDRITCNIKSSEAKGQILNDIKKHGISVLQKHWHPLDERSKEHITRNPHLACLRSNGNPYYLYFSKYDDIPIIYYIDKKVHPGYQQPRIIIVKGLFDECLFDDTVIDGEMVKTTDKKWIFLMNDVIAYCGKRLTNTTLPERLDILKCVFEKLHKQDTNMDVCYFQVKKFIDIDAETTHNTLIEYSQTLNYTCRGIYYWSYNLNFKPKLFNFDEKLIQPVIRKVKDTPDFQDLPTAIVANTPILSNVQHTNTTAEAGVNAGSVAGANAGSGAVANTASVTKQIWLRKTEYPDVYDMYLDKLNPEKFGIAMVSSLHTSKLLRSVFKDATVLQFIQFNCIPKNNKWVPVSLV